MLEEEEEIFARMYFEPTDNMGTTVTPLSKTKIDGFGHQDSWKIPHGKQVVIGLASGKRGQIIKFKVTG